MRRLFGRVVVGLVPGPVVRTLLPLALPFVAPPAVERGDAVSVFRPFVVLLFVQQAASRPVLVDALSN